MNKFKEILFLKSLKRVGKAKIYGKYWKILNACEDIDDLILKLQKLESKFTIEDLQLAKNNVEELYSNIIESNIHVITVFDDNYPKKLEVMGNKKPLILYVKGNVDALNNENIAVIGTRKPSKLSQEFEENLVRNMVNSTGRVIVSGLALGCDRIAHKTTVDENKATIAILPSGVNVITPASNKKLAEDILETGGCLISEYEPDAKAYKSTYVERDQIVAAFSDVTFVVECGVKSGTMHTVAAAEKFNKQIFTYLPDEKQNGKYDGNEYILSKNNQVIKVTDIKTVLHDLNNLNLNDKQQTLI